MYAPGVVNQSGQILAQSMNGAVDNIAQGYQQYKQNQLLATQATAKFDAATQANPELLAYLSSEQANPDLKSAFGKLSKGGAVNFKDAAALSTFADSFVAGKQKKQQQDINQAQLDALAQQRQQQNIAAIQNQKNNAAVQAAMAGGDKSKFLSTYTQQGGDIRGLKDLGFDVDKMLAPDGGKMAPTKFRSQDDLKSQFPPDKYDWKVSPQADGSVLAYDISPRAPIQQQPEVPNPLTQEIYKTFAAERNTTVAPAVRSVAAFNQIGAILNDPSTKVINGQFANPQLAMKRIGNALGFQNTDVAPTQIVRSLFSGPVAAYIKNLGSGTGLSDADRLYAQQAVGGDITLDAEAMKKLVKIGKQASRDTIKDYKDRLDATFPEKTDSPSFREARAALTIPAYSEKDDEGPAPLTPAEQLLQANGINYKKGPN
jgi:hypothetical protein